MRNLGVAVAGAGGARRKDDFYPTPPEATHALVRRWSEHIPRNVWESACGDGAMADVIHSYGYEVILSDVEDRGCSAIIRDFMSFDRARAPAIITNPPFNLAHEFIRHATNLSGATFVALLLKSTYWHAARREALFKTRPPSFIHPLLWRLDFDGRGAPTMDCAWNVWLFDGAPTRYEPIPKPDIGVFG